MKIGENKDLIEKKRGKLKNKIKFDHIIYYILEMPRNTDEIKCVFSFPIFSL